jgi:predicted RNA-binding protein with PUA-like domain
LILRRNVLGGPGSLQDDVNTSPGVAAPGIACHDKLLAIPPCLSESNVTYWLMKSEPDTYGIDDLERDRMEPWEGVRNYQARNMIRDNMQPGERSFFYHSSCETPAIVGIVTIASRAYPDPTQYDPRSKYFDPKSTEESPRWFLVDVAFERKLKRPITLQELKEHPALTGFLLTRRGNRLSVFPVTEKHWELILSLE